jgi:hypothetical protein
MQPTTGAGVMNIGGTWVNYEAWNRYVLATVGVFGVLLYCGLVYAGFIEFRARISKRSGHKKRPRKKLMAQRMRDTKISEDGAARE